MHVLLRNRSPGFRSFYSPRLPIRADSGYHAAFVPITVAGRREHCTPFPRSGETSHTVFYSWFSLIVQHLLAPLRPMENRIMAAGSQDAVFHPGFDRPGATAARRMAILILRAGLPASDSTYLPRLPVHADSGTVAAFVLGYGGGSATVFHRLPCWASRALAKKNYHKQS